MGVNKVIVVGNLGSEPEMRFMPSGQPVTNLRVASSRRYYKEDGTLMEQTEWFNVVTFGKLAETCNQFLAKGRQVYIEGRLQTRTWEDNEGRTHYRAEVIAQSVQFLGTPKEVGKSEEETAEPEQEEIPEVAPLAPEKTKPATAKAKSTGNKPKVIKKAGE